MEAFPSRSRPTVCDATLTPRCHQPSDQAWPLRLRQTKHPKVTHWSELITASGPAADKGKLHGDKGSFFKSWVESNAPALRLVFCPRKAPSGYVRESVRFYSSSKEMHERSGLVTGSRSTDPSNNRHPPHALNAKRAEKIYSWSPELHTWYLT